jgi:hypothetical protein
MRARLYRELETTGGLSIPLGVDPAGTSNERNANGSGAAAFPSYLLKRPPSP